MKTTTLLRMSGYSGFNSLSSKQWAIFRFVASVVSELRKRFQAFAGSRPIRANFLIGRAHGQKAECGPWQIRLPFLRIKRILKALRITLKLLNTLAWPPPRVLLIRWDALFCEHFVKAKRRNVG